MNLNSKILLSAPLSIIGMLVVSAIFYVGYNQEAVLQQQIQKTEEALQVKDGIEISFLELRRSEKDFLLRRDEKYSQRFDTYAEKTSGQISALSKQLNAIFDGELDASVSELGTNFATYLSTFQSLNNTVKSLGFTEKEGLQGELRGAVHNAEEKLKEINSPELTVKMLMMRRHEKDFIMRGTEKYIGRIDSRIQELKAMPGYLFGSLANRTAVLKNIDDYQAKFVAYTNTYLEERKLRKALSASYSEMGPIFKSIREAIDSRETEIRQQIAEGEQQLFLTISIALLMTVLVIGAACYFLANSISKPLNRSINVLQRLADGETDILVTDQDRKDELGGVAVAINQLRENALEKIRNDQQSATERSERDQNQLMQVKEKEQQAESMNRAIADLGDGLRKLSDGDLTFQLQDAFAEEFEGLRADFNDSVVKINRTMQQIINGVHSIDDKSKEMGSSADSLSRRTESQAASLEETSAALEEITATVGETSTRAQEASQAALQAKKDTSESSGVVTNAISAMERIEKASGEISQIIGVIDEIAFQTNLLALNAGVEAARAGEAGAGFAVVAQEVRELAQRSATAAKEIKDLITKSNTEVSGGVGLVKATGESLENIAKQVSAMTEKMSAISQAADEQLSGIKEVNVAVSDMDQITQQNAAMVEESTAVTSTLTKEVGDLMQMIGQFRLDGSSANDESDRQAA